MRFLLLLSFFIGTLISFAASQKVVVKKTPPTLQKPKTSVNLCDNGAGIFKLDYVKLYPNPPTKGTRTRIEFKGHLQQPIPKNSIVNFTIRAGVFEVVHKQVDVCSASLSTKPGGVCPISPGEYQYALDLDLPQELPNGDYSLDLDVFTPQGKRITCLKINTTI